eukprot:1138736-Pelagomonas_calceolata.AAC.1
MPRPRRRLHTPLSVTHVSKQQTPFLSPTLSLKHPCSETELLFTHIHLEAFLLGASAQRSLALSGVGDENSTFEMAAFSVIHWFKVRKKRLDTDNMLYSGPKKTV